MADIYTIGHSNHPIEKFMSLLKQHNIQVLADVRIMPRSRFNPQFNGTRLAESLVKEGIEYVHFIDLGGHRQPRPDSPNQAIESDSFRGYADHMATKPFKVAADKIIEISARKNIVTMCAEAKPSECHRLLLADYFFACGHTALHILPPGNIQPHELTKFAVAGSHEVTYPLPLFR